MSSASYKRNRVRGKNKKQKKLANMNRLFGLIIIAVMISGFVYFASRSSNSTETVSAENAPVPASNSDNPYAGIPGPNDWTEETAVQIYNRRNGQWEQMTYGDVGPDMEFIVGNYVYATTPENGSLFLKPEIDISLLAETDRSFNPDNWRMPKPDDVVFLFKSSSDQQKGHWLLKDVQPDSEIVFQGKVWQWELDVENQRFVVSDTGNVFARVTETHVNFHEDDVLALTVLFDSCGKIDIITGSEEHPFYVLDVEDYVPMVDLQPDMRLKTDSGSLVTVVELKPLDESMELYNLTVEHVQNYYIYTSENDPGVLVHNTGPCGFAPGTAISALTPDRLQHASRHLTDAGLLPNWSKATGEQFIQLATNILENPTQTFNHTLRGGTAAKGFYGVVDGQDVVIFVFRDGPNAGKVATSIVPSAQQMANWGIP